MKSLRDIKRNPSTLAKVAGLLLFMQLVYMYFQVLPGFSGSSWQRLLPDFPADHLSVGLEGLHGQTPPFIWPGRMAQRSEPRMLTTRWARRRGPG